MQCYTTQREPRVFENADSFMPARWLEPLTDEMKEMNMPFAKGPRACLGKSLAMIELKLITAALMRDFKVWQETLDQIPNLRHHRKRPSLTRLCM